MLFLFAIIGLGVCLIYLGKALKKTGTFLESISEYLAESKVHTQYKPRKIPKARPEDPYLDKVRDEINELTKMEGD